MDTILKKIGELLLSSIPALVALLTVWAAYRLILYTRLQQVLAERQALTEGAMQQAREEIAEAEQRTAEYERQVREARTEIFQSQEAHVRRSMDERGQALAEARRRADEMIRGARTSLEAEVTATKATLQQQTDSLANEIIETVLKPAMAVGDR